MTLGLRKVKTFAELVRIEHTVFNLPFAYLGAFTAAGGLPSWRDLFWITVAMVGARSAAMGMNRLFDAEIDAKTPRTRNRHIPAGLIDRRSVWVMVGISLVLLLVAAVQLDPLAVKLFPLAVFTFTVYSFTKRFTWLCHLWLGLSVAWAPFGAYVAVAGRVSLEAFVLAAIVTLWNFGFDIFYGTQDMEADRVNGVHSIPVRFGLARSLVIARFVHLAMVVVALYFGFAAGLLQGINPLGWSWAGWIYLAGWAVVAGLLHYEHSLLSPTDMSRLNAAFFNVNGYISIVFFLFTGSALLAA